MAETFSDTFIGAIPDLTLMVRYDGTILGCLGGRDLAHCDGTGRAQAGRTLDQLWGHDVGQRLRQLVRHALKGCTPLDRQCRLADRAYEVRLRPQGIDRVLMVFRELAAGVAASTPELQPIESRSQFIRWLEQAASEARLRERPLAVITVHLGGLAATERAFDVTVAEQLVAAAADRLRAFISRELTATIANERTATEWVPIADHVLAAVIQQAPTREALRTIVQRMRELLVQPFELLGRSMYLSPAFGIAFAPEDGVTAQELLNRARSAMYDAHHAGRTIAFHSDTLRLRALSRLDSEHELRWALEREQFQLDYQPLYAVGSSAKNCAAGKQERLGPLAQVGAQLAGIQARPSWAHPVRGHVAAEEFLALAETSELARDLGRWMLSRACGDLTRSSAGAALFAVVDLCRRHLLSEKLVEDVTHAIAVAGMQPQCLTLSISERELTTPGELLPRLQQLRAAGVRIIIERFGAVHFAMDRLAALPVDLVNLDAKVVNDLEGSERTRTVCRCAIDVAHVFGWKVAAQFVTTQGQLKVLQDLGCDFVGGELFGPPQDLPRLLASGSVMAAFDRTVM